MEDLVSNPSIASSFDVLVLDTSCEGLNQSEAQIIAGIGKPVLAVGNGGYEFLNHLGAQITSQKIVQQNAIHTISISNLYYSFDAHYHIVFQYPHQVNYSIHTFDGQVVQRYFLLPLSNDSLTLTNSLKLIPLAEDYTGANYYFLSIYNNSNYPYMVHWALHNITTISQDPLGNISLQVLINTLYWLKDKNPYSVRITPDYYEYNASQVANIGVAAIYNLNLTFHEGVNLTVNIIDENQTIVHSVQIVTGSQPVYISFQIPSISSLYYVINVTDGALFFLEQFIVQSTDYQITEFTATPNTVYLGNNVVLNACVAVDGNPVPNIVVYWSIINRIAYPNVNFADNWDLYSFLGVGVTNSSGYASYNWVPQETGIYEIVAWIMSYKGTPKNWTNTSVTVRGNPELSVNLVGVNSIITVGNTLRFKGNLTLLSQPFGNINLSVTIYCPGDHLINYIIPIGGAGHFSLELIPNARGIHTVFFTYPGNLTMDSITKGLQFSAYQIVAGLETNAKDGRIKLGESILINAEFGSLGFTPKLNDPVTLLVTDINGNIVFSKGYTIGNLTCFQTQWTPQTLGDYKITLYFNESYTIATTSGTIKVTSPESDSNSINLLLGFSGLSLNNSSSGVPLQGILAFTGLGLLGSVILFTRLRKNRNEILNDWPLGESDTRGTEEV